MTTLARLVVAESLVAIIAIVPVLLLSLLSYLVAPHMSPVAIPEPLQILAGIVLGSVLVLGMLGMPVIAAWIGGLIAARIIGGRSHAVLWSVAAIGILVAGTTFYGTMAIVISTFGE
jgi:hypothetical protein